MRLSAFAGLFVFGIVAIASISTVEAEALDITQIENKNQIVAMTADLQQNNIEVKEATTKEAAAPEPPKPVEHVVAAGENLSKIAEIHQTTWKRIFDKNTDIANPDVINPGDKLVIPAADELLQERELPAAHQPAAQPAVTQSSRSARSASSTAPKRTQASQAARGSSSGNTYSPGYCTWYAKNMRPDLPNNLGNANTWVSRAAAQGIPTGSAPRPGAIGQQGMHVVYVQSVNGDGTVTISEMNYNGLYVISSRTVPASTFMYIY